MTDRPMRVVLAISNLEYGGAQRQVIELANALDGAEFEMHVCTLSEYVPLANLLNFPSRLHIIPKRHKFDLVAVWQLGRLLRSLGAAIVHGYLFDAVIAARIAGRLSRTPAVIGSERNAEYTLKFRQKLAYHLTRGCTDLIIANSRAGAEFNRRLLRHDPYIYRIIYNGVDTARFSPRDASDVRRTVKIAESDCAIGMFASFKEQKNHELFFRAAEMVAREHLHATFVLVGDELAGGMHGSDAYKLRMERLINELGIRSRCRFLGNRSDVAALYCACDMTVLPSHYEGTPNVLLESMACGVPVIATDIADNALIAPHGTAGFIIPPGDARALAARMGELIVNHELRKRLGKHAREWVCSELSVGRLAARTAEAYREALAGKSLNGEPRTDNASTSVLEKALARLIRGV